jgi:hypothetical protein
VCLSSTDHQRLRPPLPGQFTCFDRSTRL